jgi:hypothetical protein
VVPGQFLLKDIGLLAVSLWIYADSARRRRRAGPGAPGVHRVLLEFVKANHLTIGKGTVEFTVLKTK